MRGFLASIQFWILMSALCLGTIASGRAQTIFGQNGIILSPSADTYRLGNFMLGGYFRSLNFGQQRYDIAPFYLVTGVAPSMEVGFAFPNIWGSPEAPDFSDDFAQLSLKFRIRGRNEAPWRLALAALVQRGMIPEQAETTGTPISVGAQIISSHNFYRNYHLHFYGGGVIAAGGSVNSQGFAGMGADRFIASRLQFLSDIMAATKKTESQNFSLQALIGLRYYLFSNLHITAGGGIGMGKKDFDWQYLVGLSFTSDFRQVAMFQGQDELLVPPPLETLPESVPPPVSEPAETLPTPEPSGQFWAGEVEMATRLFFDFASFQLGDNEKSAFADLCSEIADLGENVHLRVIGYADYLGSSRENLAWGIARAINVMSLLLKQVERSPDHFLITSAGEAEATDLRQTQAANQLNRRVVISTWHSFEQIRGKATTTNRVWTIGCSSSGEAYLRAEERLATVDALREIGKLDSNEILLIEAGWDPEKDPWPAMQRAAALWLFISSSSCINPSRIFLHLQPGMEVTPRNTENDYGVSPSFISVKMLQRHQGKDSQKIIMKLKNLAGAEQPRRGRMILVADFSDHRVTSSAETLALEQEPDPRKGRRFRFRWQIRPTFRIAVPENCENVALSLYIFNDRGQLVQRFPLFDGEYEARWTSRIARAWGHSDISASPEIPLTIRVLSLEAETPD